MTTTTPNLGLKEYDSTGDSNLTFAVWRADVAGISPTSNMGLIDTWAGNVSGSLVTLMNSRPPFYVEGIIYDANNYEVFSSDISSYGIHMMLSLALDTTNAGYINININSLGFKPLQKVSSGSLVAFSGGELEVGKRYLFQYNGTSFEWIYAASSGGGAPTDAQYVLTSVNGTLTNGKVITAGSNIEIDSSGSEVIVHSTSSGQALEVVSGSGTNVVTSGSTSTVNLSNTGISSGSYNQVEVDSFGRVISGSVVASGGAPTSASYVVFSADGTLTNEKVLTAGSNITITSNASSVIINSNSSGSSPLTTKGDVYVYGSANARLPIGTNNQVLTADSAQTLGMKWATPAASGGLTYSAIAPTTANITLVEDYEYMINVSGLTADRNLIFPTPSAAGKRIKLTINVGDDTYYGVLIGAATVTINGGSAATEFMRLRLANQSLEFISTSVTNWQCNIPTKFLIDRIVLGAAASSLAFANNPQVFKNLELYVSARTDKAGTGDAILFTFNGDSGANYYGLRPTIAHSATLTTAEQLGTNYATIVTITGNNAPANSFGVGIATIFDYTAAKSKIVRAYGFAFLGTSSGSLYQRDGNGVWNSTSAITSMSMTPESGPNFMALTIAELYGVQ
jgi:hypothetical protein